MQGRAVLVVWFRQRTVEPLDLAVCEQNNAHVFLVADVIVRGSVAVWLFSFIGLNELTVLSTVLVMWLLNFMLPALWGSFYVIKWQPK